MDNEVDGFRFGFNADGAVIENAFASLTHVRYVSIRIRSQNHRRPQGWRNIGECNDSVAVDRLRWSQAKQPALSLVQEELECSQIDVRSTFHQNTDLDVTA